MKFFVFAFLYPTFVQRMSMWAILWAILCYLHKSSFFENEIAIGFWKFRNFPHLVPSWSIKFRLSLRIFRSCQRRRHRFSSVLSSSSSSSFSTFCFPCTWHAKPVFQGRMLRNENLPWLNLPCFMRRFLSSEDGWNCNYETKTEDDAFSKNAQGKDELVAKLAMGKANHT